MKCTIDGCEKNAVARGWCPAHYRRWKKHGDPSKVLQVQRHGLSLQERLLQRTIVGEGCWEWTGSTDARGYGRLNVNDIPRLTHRISWEAFKGKVPDGAFVLHRCDNPKCINPAHLFLGDQADNMSDKMRKKRHRFGVSRGEKHGCARLTEEQVRSIRAAKGNLQQIADAFGISVSHTWDIKRRRVWKHLK